MKAIKSITHEKLEYIDDNGSTASIDLVMCNRNWIAQLDTNKVSKLDEKYIGWRNVCGNPPYILFFTESNTELPSHKLEFEYSSDCNVTDERFWNLLTELKRVGWRTLDLS